MATTIIGLSPGYRVKGITMCWQLERYHEPRVTEDGKVVAERWEAFKWGELGGMLRCYLDHRMRTCGATSPGELREVVLSEKLMIGSVDWAQAQIEALEELVDRE